MIESDKTILVNVYQELGLLRGQVDMLISELGHATISRNELHAKIERVDEDLQGKIDGLKLTLSPLPAIVARLEPIVTDLEEKRLQAIGAIWIIRALMLGGAAILGAVATIVTKKLGWG